MRALAASIFVILMLVSCTKGSTVTGSRHAGTIAHVLRVDDLSEPDRLNPYLSQMDISYALSSLVYSYLIVADQDGRLIGDLATRVPTLANGGISKDGKTYTYFLRRNVRWHDGQPFSARDVIASWHAVIDPHNLTLYRDGYDRVDRIDAPSPYEIIVHLKNRYPPFLSQFFAPLQEGGKPILPAHVIDRDKDFNRGSLTEQPVGTGPFAFVSWTRNDEIVLRRNDDYFRGRPKLERVELHFVPNSQTIMTQMRLHQADLWYAPPAALYPEYRSFSGLSVYTVPWNQQGLVVINGGSPGLSDVNVRRALALGTNRAAIIAKVTHGVDALPTDVIATTAIGHIDRPIVFDPVRARAMLDRAGWRVGSDGVRSKDGARLSYTIDTIAGNPTFEQIPLLMQEQWKSIGVELAIKAFPYNQIFDFAGPIDTYKYDFAIYGSALSWDPDSHVYYGCNQWYPKGQNFYRFCDATYDRFETQGLATDDPAARAAAYRQADAVLWDDVAYLPIFQTRRIVVRNADLQNYRPNPTSTPWWNAWQWDI